MVETKDIHILLSEESAGSNAALTTIFGEVLAWITESQSEVIRSGLDYALVKQILNSSILTPTFRVAVLNHDETVNYVIPLEDICLNGISYNEGYQSGDRRSISLQLINVEKPHPYVSGTTYKPYLPSINTLWYNTKISFDAGFIYNGKEYLLRKGIYIITSFDLSHSTSDRKITYELKDKFCQFSGNMGIVEAGYEIPVGTPIEQCLNDLLNLSQTNGLARDLKACLLDSRYTNAVTQTSIRIDEGGKLSDLIQQLGTQMSSEYYYNNFGNLTFMPIDDSMNDINKPIIWEYKDIDISGLNIKASDDIVNVVKVTGTNVDGAIYTGEAKNENLTSPINIYTVCERRGETINDANVYTDDMAKEYAEYNLRNKTLYQLSQTIEVPFNPLLVVNNLIEITNEDLDIDRSLWLIKGISYSTGNSSMSIEIAALDSMPFFLTGGMKRGQ